MPVGVREASRTALWEVLYRHPRCRCDAVRDGVPRDPRKGGRQMSGMRASVRCGTVTAIAWLWLFVCPALLHADPPRRLADEPAAVAGADKSLDLPDRPKKSLSRPASKSTTPASSLWTTAVTLVIVLGCLAAVLVVLRRHGPPPIRPLPSDVVEILGRRVLEPRISLQLVRVGTRVLVLSVSPDGVRTLSEINDPIEINLLAGACRRGEASTLTSSFRNLFEQQFGYSSPADEPPDTDLSVAPSQGVVG